MFNNIVKQDMEFFDKSENTTGALVSRLSEHPTYINEFISINVTFITASIVSAFSTSILAIAIGWKLGLVVVFGALMPLIFCGWLRIRLEMNLDDHLQKKSGDSASLAAEAIASMRTVSSLTLESHFLDRFNNGLAAIEKDSMRSVIWTMVWYSLSQSINFLCMGLGFWLVALSFLLFQCNSYIIIGMVEDSYRPVNIPPLSSSPFSSASSSVVKLPPLFSPSPAASPKPTALQITSFGSAHSLR